MANWTQDAVDALAAAVSERRRMIGRSQIEVWRNGGPSNSTMTSLETAASLSVAPSTLKKLDTGLVWVPDTAAKVIRGEVPPAAAARDARFDARRSSDIGLDDGTALGDSAVTRDDFSALIAALAVDADDVQLRTRALNIHVDTHDPEAVKSFVSEVQDVVGDIDDFAESVDGTARRVFGGDTDWLRRVKRETKRFRRQLSAGGALSAVAAIAEDASPASEGLRAARTAPAGYAAGQAEQGEAGGDTTDAE
jgi:hypothetical protein